MFRNREEEKKDSKKTKRENEDDTSWFNLYRSIMLLAACSVILAIDFSQTPRRLGKMKEYGVSVMDVGVGSFVFSASCVKWRSSSSSSNSNSSFYILSKILFFVFSLVRYASQIALRIFAIYNFYVTFSHVCSAF